MHHEWKWNFKNEIVVYFSVADLQLLERSHKGKGKVFPLQNRCDSEGW